MKGIKSRGEKEPPKDERSGKQVVRTEAAQKLGEPPHAGVTSPFQKVKED